MKSNTTCVFCVFSILSIIITLQEDGVNCGDCIKRLYDCSYIARIARSLSRHDVLSEVKTLREQLHVQLHQIRINVCGCYGQHYTWTSHLDRCVGGGDELGGVC